MKIGIVTTWFERGAAYVSKIFMDLLVKEGHEVYIYARGGEDLPSQRESKWNQAYVTRDETYTGMLVNRHKFFRWIVQQSLDAVFFNEQQHFKIVAQTKKRFPNIKIGAYVDYYTENTLPWFRIDHHSEIVYLESVACQDNAGDILAYVMDIALDSGQNNPRP